ncbi:hypothetical protein MUK42_28020 [Musa troglodytarum]|uniref:Uncharacterized protein n=1 Tax=Musa troglodytarum TaxID=320322 RepID=A0A9E7F2Q3_9LILI|nr:hypothetical protein MUK42_28020 [Musa troglodytarum]
MRSPLIALFASASPNRDGDSRMSEAAKIKKLPLLVISSTLASLSSSKMETWSSPTAASPILSRAGGLIRVGPFEFLERVRMHEFAEGTLHPFNLGLNNKKFDADNLQLKLLEQGTGSKMITWVESDCCQELSTTSCWLHIYMYKAAAVRSSLYILLFGKRRSLYTLNSPCVCLFPTPSCSFQPNETFASPVLMANTFYGSGPLRPRFFSLLLLLFCVKSTRWLQFEPARASDEIQLQINLVHVDVDEHITGLRG